ncbi:MAG: hypothetical protein ACXVJB_13325 [Mucilaginibacter sp.]
MQWVLFLVLIFLAILSYLLFAPIYIEIDSTSRICRLRFHHLASGAIVLKNYRFELDLRIAWWKKQFHFFAKNQKKKKPENITSTKERTRGRRISFKTITAIVKTFKVNIFRVDIDTDNVQLNGLLYPAFYAMSRFSGRHMMINFVGNNEIVIEIENNLARMIRAFISSLLKQNNHGKFR